MSKSPEISKDLKRKGHETMSEYIRRVGGIHGDGVARPTKSVRGSKK